tara:strand:+ start:616 stop:717 length:102 start_codon:yes stop_codon:yes gene_type:complete
MAQEEPAQMGLVETVMVVAVALAATAAEQQDFV